MTFPALVHANIAKGMSVNVVYVNGNLIMDLIPLKDNTLIATAKLIKIIELSKLISAKKRKPTAKDRFLTINVNVHSPLLNGLLEETIYHVGAKLSSGAILSEIQSYPLEVPKDSFARRYSKLRVVYVETVIYKLLIFTFLTSLVRQYSTCGASSSNYLLGELIYFFRSRSVMNP